MFNFSKGGHYPKPILFDGIKADYIAGEGFAVGIFNEAIYNSYQLKLPEQFSFIMYSDGIMEILTGNSMEENEKILLEKSSDFDLDASNILERFNIAPQNTPIPDDIAFLLIRKK